MSGGYYDYKQWQLTQLADEIERDIEKIGKVDEWGSTINVSEKSAIHMRLIANTLRLASDMVHDLDWCLSGDTGEDTFLKDMNIHTKTLASLAKLSKQYKSPKLPKGS